MNFLHSFSLTFLSFLPLWILIVIRGLYVLHLGANEARNAELCATIGLPVMFLCSVIIAQTFFRNLRSKGKSYYKILDCKEEKTLSLKFIVTNVFPLLCYDTTSGEGLVLTFTYFLLIASLSIRHKYFPENIWLEWLGWSFWRCKVENSMCPEYAVEKIIVSRSRIAIGKKMELTDVNNETLADLSKEGK